MRTANQHEGDAMDFVSRAFTGGGQSEEMLAAARVEAALAGACGHLRARDGPAAHGGSCRSTVP
jgi:hypothetical protein